MPTVARTVELDVPYANAFELSNRIEQWPLMMEEYRAAEVLRQEGFKIWFRLTHSSGSSWTSWRLLRPESGVALAERHEPRAPFAFMHHTWTYRALGPNRTSMTWTMRFGLPAPTEEQDRACSAYLLSSTERNQARMKAYIEDTYRKGNGS